MLPMKILCSVPPVCIPSVLRAGNVFFRCISGGKRICLSPVSAAWVGARCQTCTQALVPAA